MKISQKLLAVGALVFGVCQPTDGFADWISLGPVGNGEQRVADLQRCNYRVKATDYFDREVIFLLDRVRGGAPSPETGYYYQDFRADLTKRDVHLLSRLFAEPDSASSLLAHDNALELLGDIELRVVVSHKEFGEQSPSVDFSYLRPDGQRQYSGFKLNGSAIFLERNCAGATKIVRSTGARVAAKK